MQKVRSVEAFLLECGCDARSARQMAVVAEELLVNILSDAWPDGSPGHCGVEVTAAAGEGAVQVSLRTEDDGVAFDPTGAAEPDLEASLEDRAIGGLGIHLVRTMTDAQSYRRAGDRNVFEVSKACPRA